MDRPPALAILFALVAILGMAAWGGPGAGGAAEEETVVLYDGDAAVATIQAEVADTPQERYVGLSEHDDLADDRGMLFVFGTGDERTVRTDEMAFGIDVVFVDEPGCVTAVHAIPGPDDRDDDREYAGEGRYVLEVPLGVASEAGVSPGDPVRIEWGETVVDGQAACPDS